MVKGYMKTSGERVHEHLDLCCQACVAQKAWSRATWVSRAVRNLASCPDRVSASRLTSALPGFFTIPADKSAKTPRVLSVRRNCLMQHVWFSCDDYEWSSVNISKYFPHFPSRALRIPLPSFVCYNWGWQWRRGLGRGVSKFGRITWKNKRRRDAQMEIPFEERDPLVIKSISVSIKKGTVIRRYIKEKDWRSWWRYPTENSSTTWQSLDLSPVFSKSYEKVS